MNHPCYKIYYTSVSNRSKRFVKSFHAIVDKNKFVCEYELIDLAHELDLSQYSHIKVTPCIYMVYPLSDEVFCENEEGLESWMTSHMSLFHAAKQG